VINSTINGADPLLWWKTDEQVFCNSFACRNSF